MRIRAALHVHSTWSYDGTCSLTEVAALFRRFGYGCVLMSEHSRTFDEARWLEYRSACASASDQILLIPGIEYEDAANDVHVLVWGAESFFGAAPETLDMLRRVRAERALAILAHPNRRGALGRVTGESGSLLDGIEIWNRRYDGWVPPMPIPALEGDVLETVGLDFHRRLDFFPLALELDVTSPLSAEAVVDAIRMARYVRTLAGIPVSRVAGGPGRRVAASLDRARKAAARLFGLGS